MLRMKDKLGEGTSVPLGYVVTTLPDLDYPPLDYFTWKRKKLLLFFYCSGICLGTFELNNI